jgi:uncharacterized protein YbjT (DUF2867 family)
VIPWVPVTEPLATALGPVLVVGASGHVGGRVARSLLGRGRAVWALARPGSDLGDLEDRGARRCPGDLRDPDSLARATEGASAVVVTATGARGGPGDSPSAVDDGGVRALIDAAGRAGARRFLLVSAEMARAESRIELVRAKASAEAHLATSGLAWTILAPEMFTESWLGLIVEGPAGAGAPVLLVDGAPPRPFVSEVDVAAAVVAALDVEWTVGARLPIGGPELLAWEEVVDRVALRLGRRPAVVRLTAAEAYARNDHLALLLEPVRAPHPEELAIAGRLGITLTPWTPP